MKRISGFLLLLGFLSGCAQLPQQSSETSKTALWLEHQLSVSMLDVWHIKGRVAIKNEKQSGTITLHWKQNPSDYELRFIAPFGQGTYILKGSPKGVTIVGSDNKVLHAATPEHLMYQVFGWAVHLDGLKYWVRGVPEPDLSYTGLRLDQQGRLTNMEQSGFNVAVSRYTESGGVALPEKLTIDNDSIRLKLIIKSWEI